jgi:hypothetical protein
LNPSEENCIVRGLIVCTGVTYYSGDKIEDEMGGAFTHMRKMKCIKKFGQKM